MARRAGRAVKQGTHWRAVRLVGSVWQQALTLQCGRHACRSQRLAQRRRAHVGSVAAPMQRFRPGSIHAHSKLVAEGVHEDGWSHGARLALRRDAQAQLAGNALLDRPRVQQL